MLSLVLSNGLGTLDAVHDRHADVHADEISHLDRARSQVLPQTAYGRVERGLRSLSGLCLSGSSLLDLGRGSTLSRVFLARIYIVVSKCIRRRAGA